MKKLKSAEEILEAIYLEISRRFIWYASIWTEEDIYRIAQFSYVGNMKHLKKDCFGVEVSAKDEAIRQKSFLAYLILKSVTV